MIVNAEDLRQGDVIVKAFNRDGSESESPAWTEDMVGRRVKDLIPGDVSLVRLDASPNYKAELLLAVGEGCTFEVSR